MISTPYKAKKVAGLCLDLTYATSQPYDVTVLMYSTTMRYKIICFINPKQNKSHPSVKTTSVFRIAYTMHDTDAVSSSKYYYITK